VGQGTADRRSDAPRRRDPAPMDTTWSPRTVAVVGGGLIGGSVALACRRSGIERVVLTDTDVTVRARARRLGLATEVVDDLETAVADADLVVAAVPGPAVAPVLERVAAAAPAAAILTDAASLKRDVTAAVEARLGAAGHDPGRYVGGHPMAGSERSGPDAADGSLFQGATWVLTPTAATADAALHALSGLLRSFGARVLALPPDQHDELVAIVSHLPQVAASALADVAADMVDVSGEVVLAVAGGGFRDTTRIAASDPELWLPILAGNRDAVVAALDHYRTRLDVIRDAVVHADAEALRRILARASRSRRRLVPKERAANVVDLVVPLADRPGALAAATTALGAAGINVEDVAMRHAEAGDRGVLLVRIAEDAAPGALAALGGAGLAAHVEPVAADRPADIGDAPTVAGTDAGSDTDTGSDTDAVAGTDPGSDTDTRGADRTA
jgi:prephenate dehydrogenase